ncbi:MAG TPA: glycosyltransferase [Streptosporangiaceae bacterium]|nr:glycosyltransferase [Streptosporangiaceae bacterium]
MIESVAVVVPAHDEEELLPACLTALRLASEPLDPVPVRLVVVADACADATAGLARRAGADVVEIKARNVGAARASGFSAVLSGIRPADLATMWLASTDADTLVAPDWLLRQVRLAQQGWDAVVGTVMVSDWSAHPAHVRELFTASYRPGPGPHPHVHGANLGMTADAYLAAGGFRELRTAEDHALVASLAAAGRRILRTSDVTVATSARRQARAPHGFSHLLATLA